MAKAYYQETGGATTNYTWTNGIPDGNYQVATKFVVPAGVEVTITDTALSLGATAGIFAPLFGVAININIKEDSGGQPTGSSRGQCFYWNSTTTQGVSVRTTNAADITLEEGTYWAVMEMSSEFVGNSAIIMTTQTSTNMLTEDPLLSSTTGESYHYNGSWSKIGDYVHPWIRLNGSAVEVAAAPDKATTPNPSNGATTDGCYDRYFTWNGDADADTHDFYIGASAGSLVKQATVATEYYTVSEANFPKNSEVYWRVDSTNEAGTTTGDVWSFDPRPTKVDNPTPPNGTGSLTINPSRLYWDQGTLNQSWDVWFGPSGNMVQVASGETNEYWDTSDLGVYSYIPLDYGTTYQWRIDSVNANGTTTGDTWSFTTATWAPPAPSNSPLKAAGGGSVNPGGGTFIDGANFVASNRRLIAACANAIWYEPYDEADA